MDNNINSNSLFDKLSPSILSTIFVLAQNPQLSLLNKNMHYATQQMDTISKYILQYVLSDSEDNTGPRLREILKEYTKININETIGILVLRKIRNLNCETGLELAFKYRWRNVLKKLLKMYVVIDRDISTVVYKGTLFINENEYLDIDTSFLFDEENEFLSELTDIKISGSHYIRPLMATSWIYSVWEMNDEIYNSDTIFEIEDVEALIDICNSKIEIPKELAGFVEEDFRYINSKAVICLILCCANEICQFNNLELMKRILDLKIEANFSIEELELHEEYSDGLAWNIPIYFIEEYEYESQMDLLIYITYSYYSIECDRKEMIKFLEENYPDVTYQQILFDAAIHHRKEELVKEYFFKVDPNSENIQKIIEIVYENGSVDLIRFLLNNCGKMEGELDENVLKTVIREKDCELAKDIIISYPNIVSVSCLEEAVKSGDVRIAKLIIESGVDLKGSEFRGIDISIENKDIEMLQLLLENGASVGLMDDSVIEKLCSIKNYEIANRLLEFSDKDKVKSKISGGEDEVEKRLKFNKTILCLIEANKYYNRDYAGKNAEFEDFHKYLDLFEKVMAIVNLTKKNITNVCASHFYNHFNASRKNQVKRAFYDKSVAIIDYIVKNNLQNTLEDAEYDKTCELGENKYVEVLNDCGYELVKSELVIRNFEMLKLLIKYGADVNSTDSLILRTAYKAGDIGWIDYFISKGAKLNGRSDGFKEACKSNKVGVLKHWIRNGGVVPKNPGYPCIKMACLLGNFNMVKFLVENGVDLGNPERNGVRIACRLGLKRTLKYLLDNNAVIEGVRHYQLEYACLIEDVGLVKMILEHYDRLEVLERKDKTNTKGQEELQNNSFMSVENSDLSEEYKIIKTLLKKGKPIQNSDLLDGVMAAIAVANVEILKMLLTYKIDLKSEHKILKFAVKLGNIGVVRLLIMNGLSVKGNTCILDIAPMAKNTEMTRFLLQHGAKVIRDMYYLANNLDLDDIEILQLILTYNSKIRGDLYLIRAAIENNKLEAVKLLLKDRVTLEDSEYNYIIEACKSNCLEILKFLFEKGARVKKGNKSGVIEACGNNNLEILKLLFERNPNLVLNRRYGLSEAIENKNIKIIRLLIKHGADPSEHIESILRFANEMNDHELIEFCQNMCGRN